MDENTSKRTFVDPCSVVRRRPRLQVLLVLQCFFFLMVAVGLGCASRLSDASKTANLIVEEVSEPRLPNQSLLDLGQLRIHTNFELNPSHRLLVEVQQLRNDISETLNVEPSDEPIHVYLFSTPTEFKSYAETIHGPIANRRAFFVQTDTTLSVYAVWSDQVAIDLRHELTHAYLHSVVPRLPLWLDEGIAEYFEVAPGQGGWNLGHARALRRMPLIALKDLEQIADPAIMKQEEYASSWMWVHFLVNHSKDTRSLLHQHISEWRDHSEASRLSTIVSEKIPDAELIVANELNADHSG